MNIPKRNRERERESNQLARDGLFNLLNQKPIAIFVLTLLFLSSGCAIVQAALTISATNITSDGSLTLTAGGSNQNIILTPSGTGNVGIGTTTPGTLLTVAGAANITGALTVASCSGCGGSGSPGGSDKQIQFNNGGSFGGDANFTWASTTQLLTLTGTSTVSGKLGVATTTPSSTLDVFGDINTNSYYRYKGNIILSVTSTALGQTLVGANAGPTLSVNSSQNTLVGFKAGFAMTDSALNTAVGWQALMGAIGNTNNSVAVGVNALQKSAGGSSFGGGATAIGTQALQNATTTSGTGGGDKDVAVGFRAGATSIASGLSELTGHDNTFIGYNTGFIGTSSYTNATAIGSEALVGQSNALVLGATGAGVLPQVNVGIGTTTPATLFSVATTSPIFHVTNGGPGLVGVGTTTPATTLHVTAGVTPTLRIGGPTIAGCIELLDSAGNGTINYITAASGVLSATTTKPAACQ